MFCPSLCLSVNPRIRAATDGQKKKSPGARPCCTRLLSKTDKSMESSSHKGQLARLGRQSWCILKVDLASPTSTHVQTNHLLLFFSTSHHHLVPTSSKGRDGCIMYTGKQPQQARQRHPPRKESPPAPQLLSLAQPSPPLRPLLSSLSILSSPPSPSSPHPLTPRGSWERRRPRRCREPSLTSRPTSNTMKDENQLSSRLPSLLPTGRHHQSFL